jgi:CRISPR-associated protein Cas6
VTTDVDASVVDLAFHLAGGAIPRDHADALWQEILDVLPWAAEESLFAVHPLARISQGGEEVYLTRHSRLTLRLPAVRAEAAGVLAGRRLGRVGGAEVGAPKVRPLAPACVLHSSFVHIGISDETDFLAACRELLAELAPEAHMVSGKARRLYAGGKAFDGYSVMLHGISDASSMRVQQRGMGSERHRGCGIFVPHKSITAVGD